MHEIAAMQAVVTTVLERMYEAGADRVTRVELELGASSHLTEEAARQHFATLAKGTPAEGAELQLAWLPATYQCFTCLRRFESVSPPLEALCPDCGGPGLEISHQDICAARAIEVTTGPSSGPIDDTRQADLANKSASTGR